MPKLEELLAAGLTASALVAATADLLGESR
jgi:hypothetical protein